MTQQLRQQNAKRKSSKANNGVYIDDTPKHYEILAKVEPGDDYVMIYHCLPLKYLNSQSHHNDPPGVGILSTEFKVWHHNVFNKPGQEWLTGLWCADSVMKAIYGSQKTKNRSDWRVISIKAEPHRIEHHTIGGHNYMLYRAQRIWMNNIKLVYSPDQYFNFNKCGKDW